jgi:hypothetical protein
VPTHRGAIVWRAAVLAAFVATPRPAQADPMSTSPEQAYDLGEMPGARAVAMGGALTALGVSTTALYLNPANMSLARVYHIETFAAFSPEAGRQTYGAAAVDSVINTSHVAGGFAGTWSELDPDGIHRTWTDLRAGASFPLGEYFSIGATARWLRVEQAVSAGPFGSSAASDGTAGSPIFNSPTFDLGATGSLGGFRLGVVGHNLTNPGNALAPTTGAAGLGYTSEVFSIEGDGLLDFTTWGKAKGRLMAGGEVFVADRYALRVGWRYDAGMNINSPSLGVGYIDPHWSVELGLRRDLISAHAETYGVLSLRYFYDPTGASSPPNEPDLN